MGQPIDDKTLKQAIGIAKGVLSSGEAEKIEKFFSDQNAVKALAAQLSQRDMQTVAGVMGNPALLKAVLQSPKGREAIRNLLNNKP